MRCWQALGCALALVTTGCGETAGTSGAGGDPGPGSGGVGGDGAMSEQAQLIDAYLEDYISNNDLEPEGPGFAIAILGPTGIVYERAFGMANVEGDLPIAMDVPFNLGSVSKMFTAIGVLVLYEEGKLDLEDPIRDYFPEGPSSWDPVTVHHLLTHQAGVPGVGGGAQGWTNEEVIDWLIEQELLFEPGEGYEYTDTAYILLASMIERVAEEPFETFMDERIYGPLGMEDSVIMSLFPPEVEGGAISYLGTQPFQWPKRAVGATSQYSSIDDLLQWEAELRDVTLVSPETLELATTGYVSTFEGCEYGYGWQVCDVEGWPPDTEHSGRHNGFRSGFYRAPGEGLAVMMVSNATLEAAFRDLVLSVASLYLNGVAWPEG